jgi:hypothetical protein
MSKKVSLADPLTESYDPNDKWFRELRNPEKPGMYLFRILLSKLMYTEEDFTESDEVQLFLSYEKVVDLCSDPGFKKKYFYQIFLVRNIFYCLPGFVRDRQSIIDYRKHLDSAYSYGRSFLNAFIYYGATELKKVHLVSKEPHRLKAKNRIGVGYRDKGNARNTAWDGSPTWQEVAASEQMQAMQTQSSTKSERVSDLWEHLRVGNFYPWQRSEKIPIRRDSLVRQMRG